MLLAQNSKHLLVLSSKIESKNNYAMLYELTHNKHVILTSSFPNLDNTCGGIVVGQSGTILFTFDALENTSHPSTCVWTIRANNRAQIKIKTLAVR